MSAKKLIGSLLLLAPVALGAQDARKTETKGEVSIEGRNVEVGSKSAKYNEYRDANNEFPIYKLGIEVVTPTGGFFDLQGLNLLRDDQTIRLSTGKYGLWSIVAERNETPHNLSYKAMTPFRNQGGGLFTLDSTAGIPNRNLAGTAAQMLANDAVTASWLLGQLRPTELGTQRDKTGATLTLTPSERLKLSIAFFDERKEGSKIGTGPIGDRPPRTLDAQIAKPIDFKSRELKFEAEYSKSRYQASLAYTVSKFENSIATFRWQNPYAVFSGSNSFDQWTGHRVATFGQMAMEPDNTYQNATFSLGVNLPSASRLVVSAAYGKMKQDQSLIPYSTSNFNGTTVDFSTTAALPRRSADAEITTKRVNVDYSINPMSRLGLRAFVRYYDLDNQTPQDKWWGITSDTIGGSASATITDPTYKNQRRNLAYSFEQTQAGIEASTYFNFWHTSAGLTLEQEKIDRKFREGNTDETILRGDFRMRPSSKLSLRGKALVGNRDGGTYNYNAARTSYWYDTTVAHDLDNPAVSFYNHPDMRKFDVSDRKRTELDLSAILTPIESLDIVFSLGNRKKDYDSNVTPVQPLAGVSFATSDADRAAFTPGTQLGLLENDSTRYAVDLSYAMGERLVLNAFASHEKIELTQRGIEFNENDKLVPTLASLDTNDLGPWTRAKSQWTAFSEDATDTYGFGASYEFIPQKLRFSADYSYSNGTVDITYQGFGAVSSVNPDTPLADTNQYAFRSPTTVRSKQTTLNAHLTYQFSKRLSGGLHYAYDKYDLSDWMQEANQPWFESVGSEYLLRDTSSATSNQWGNRLISLGSNLAPTYSAHYVSLSVSYRF